MLAKRVIPCLDVLGNRVVKGKRFVELHDVGDPVEKALFYDQQGADELIFLDISASAEGRKILLDVVRRTAEAVFIPFTVGGGIDSVQFIREILQNGADKVSINTAALANPELIKAGAEHFGSQCIVVAIDAKRRKSAHGSSPQWEVYSHGGRYPTGRDAVEWAVHAQELGAGEILLTSMDTDGTLSGYDLELLAAVTNAVSIPVIASGGAGRLEHLAEAIIVGGAHAVLVASIVHYGTYTIADVKQYLKQQGLPVRIPPLADLDYS